MADLIDRRAVKDAFHAYMAKRFNKDRCANTENCKVCEKKCLWHEVVASVPPVDAVEVVRCKDCIRCGFCGEATNLEVMGFYGYCSRGKRREENAAELGQKKR